MNLIIGDNDFSHVDVHDDDHDNDGVHRHNCFHLLIMCRLNIV